MWKRPGLPRLTVSHQCISVFTGCSLGTVGSASSSSARESEDMPQYRALKGLSSMFTVPSRKEKKTVNPELYLIEQFSVSYLLYKIGPAVINVSLQITITPEDAATVNTSRNSPWIGRFLVDDAEPQYFVFVEQKILCPCPSLTRAVLIWFASHYAFDLKYSKYCHDAALFFQEFIFGFPAPAGYKKSANYLAIATELKTCGDAYTSDTAN